MYNVSVDRAAMRQELLGPLFQRHVVSLAGAVDERWLASFHEVSKDSQSFQRFVLDATRGLISFTCRASDGPSIVESFVERLGLLVEMVNLHATCSAAEPEGGAPQSLSA